MTFIEYIRYRNDFLESCFCCHCFFVSQMLTSEAMEVLLLNLKYTSSIHQTTLCHAFILYEIHLECPVDYWPSTVAGVGRG
jgi:hypothetical protein